METVVLGAGGVNQQQTVCQRSVVRHAKSCKMQTSVETKSSYQKHLLGINISPCLFVCLSVCLFVCLSVCSLVGWFVFVACLLVCLFACLLACLFVCLFGSFVHWLVGWLVGRSVGRLLPYLQITHNNPSIQDKLRLVCIFFTLREQAFFSANLPYLCPQS